jgi:tRNA A-37 threonylcarbamoyl transferase component Bud32
MKPFEFRNLARAVLQHEIPFEVLKARASGTSVIRVSLQNQSYILKYWQRKPMASLLRRISRTGCGIKEWKALCGMQKIGVEAPKPLYHEFVGNTEVLFMEDLGACLDVIEVLKAYVLSGNIQEFTRLEDGIIGIAGKMIRNGWLDPDCRLPNFALTPGNQLVRLDFELAYRVHTSAMLRQDCAVMIGTLVATHLFAMQPQTMRSLPFAERLLQSVAIPPGIAHASDRIVEQIIAKQKRLSGIDTKIPFRLGDILCPKC